MTHGRNQVRCARGPRNGSVTKVATQPIGEESSGAGGGLGANLVLCGASETGPCTSGLDGSRTTSSPYRSLGCAGTECLAELGVHLGDVGTSSFRCERSDVASETVSRTRQRCIMASRLAHWSRFENTVPKRKSQSAEGPFSPAAGRTLVGAGALRFEGDLRCHQAIVLVQPR